MGLREVVLFSVLAFSSYGCVNYNLEGREESPKKLVIENNYQNRFYPEGPIMPKPEPEKPFVWKYGQK